MPKKGPSTLAASKPRPSCAGWADQERLWLLAAGEHAGGLTAQKWQVLAVAQCGALPIGNNAGSLHTV